MIETKRTLGLYFEHGGASVFGGGRGRLQASARRGRAMAAFASNPNLRQAERGDAGEPGCPEFERTSARRGIGR